MQIQEFLKDSLTLLIFIDVSLDKEIPVKFWKSSGSGFWTPDLDFGYGFQILTGFAMAEICAVRVIRTLFCQQLDFANNVKFSFF